MDELTYRPDFLLMSYAMLLSMIEMALTALAIFKKQDALAKLVWKEY